MASFSAVRDVRKDCVPVLAVRGGTPAKLRHMAYNAASVATARLAKDLFELQRNPLPGVAARPREDNILEWHANIIGLQDSRLEGVCLHLILRFPETYPAAPPVVEVCTDFPHPNITRGGHGGLRFVICLEMFELPVHDSLPYRCWSSAFTVFSILTQLRSFLLQDGQALLTNYRLTLQEAIDAARNFTCAGCGHTHAVPLPPVGTEVDSPKLPPQHLLRRVSAEVARSVRARMAVEAGQGRKAPASTSATTTTNTSFTAITQATDSHGTRSMAKEKPAVVQAEEWVTVGKGGGKKGGASTHLATTSSSLSASSSSSSSSSSLSPSQQTPIAAVKTAPRSVLDGNKYATLAEDMSSKVEMVRCAGCNQVLPACAYSNAQLKKPASVKRCMGCLASEYGPATTPLNYKPPAAAAVAKGAASPSSSAPSSPAQAKTLAAQNPTASQSAVQRAAKTDSPFTLAAPPVTSTPQPHASAWKDGWAEQGASAGMLGNVAYPCLLNIFEYLGPKDVGRLASSCRYFSALTDEGLLWRELFARRYPSSQLTAATIRDWRHVFELEVNQIADETLCWYTKATPEEDVLGFPLDFTVNPVKKTVDYVYTTGETLSLTAFQQHQVRRTVWGERFQLFLPLYLNDDHFQRALPHIRRCLVKLSPSLPGTDASFPTVVLCSLPKLLNTMVVLIADKGLAASERALEVYCQLYRLFVALAERFPGISREANQRLQDFIASDPARSKASCPSLGDLITLLSVSKRYRWQHLAVPYLRESLTRGVLWSCTTYPELAKLDGSVTGPDRLEKTLKASILSLRLIMFHVLFLRTVGHPDGLTPAQAVARADVYLGRPDIATRRAFQAGVKDILSVCKWPDVFRHLRLTLPTPQQLHTLLTDSVKASLKKGYHREDTDFSRVGRSGVSRLLLKGGEKYTVAPDLRKVCMRDKWRYEGHTQFLDASCLAYDGQGAFIEVMDFRHDSGLMGAVRHSGDVIDHEAHSGSHEIMVDLSKLPGSVMNLVFVLSAWHRQLKDILQPSVCLRDQDHGGVELCSYELEDKPKKNFTAVVMCRLYREKAGGAWNCQAIGDMCHGDADNYTQIKQHIKPLLSSSERKA